MSKWWTFSLFACALSSYMCFLKLHCVELFQAVDNPFSHDILPVILFSPCGNNHGLRLGSIWKHLKVQRCWQKSQNDSNRHLSRDTTLIIFFQLIIMVSILNLWSSVKCAGGNFGTYYSVNKIGRLIVALMAAMWAWLTVGSPAALFRSRIHTESDCFCNISQSLILPAM